jgi:SsrA-binding protein
MELIAKNKKAFFNYTIEDTYMAGLVLLGSEVKSIRNRDVSIKEAYCVIVGGEMFIRGMHIAEFKESGMYQNHDPTRERKLLLNKKEIKKLEEGVARSGFTIVPLKLIITKKGLIKLDIGLGSGKKLFDKKNAIKERDIKIDTDRELTKYQ